MGLFSARTHTAHWKQGKEPKGYTRRALAKPWQIEEIDLLVKEAWTGKSYNNRRLKTAANRSGSNELFFHKNSINLSSIPFIIIPPLNSSSQFYLNVHDETKNRVTKQLYFSNKYYGVNLARHCIYLGLFLKLGNGFTLILMILIVLSNLCYSVRTP